MTDSSQNKKGTPSGAPIPDQDHSTTPEEISEAERFFNRIRTGSEHAMARPKNAGVDRMLRKLIAEANNSGNDCIINVGFGYFRPGEEDEGYFEDYIAAERAKVRASFAKLGRMQRYFDRRYDNGNL